MNAKKTASNDNFRRVIELVLQRESIDAELGAIIGGEKETEKEADSVEVVAKLVKGGIRKGRWSLSDIAYLKQNMSNCTNAEMAHVLKRNVTSVKNMRKKLAMKEESKESPVTTPEENLHPIPVSVPGTTEPPKQDLNKLAQGISGNFGENNVQ